MNEILEFSAESKNSTRKAGPCIMVIFGATGDLTARKLFPALYNLTLGGLLPENFACVAFARRPKSNEEFREEMEEAINKYSRIKLEHNVWKRFKEKVFYHRSDFHEDEGYESLKTLLEDLDEKFGSEGNRVYYLSTPPSYFTLIAEKLKEHSLIYDHHTETEKWSRVIIEKPFGRDLKSAIDLQQQMTKFFNEDQIYRIDHYLGKETVQNLLVFRFSNPIFESVWNNRHVDNVQISVCEDLGIGTRGKFWEEAGMLRDIVQNHVMQLLSLVAMEPPTNLQAHSIRDEKVKVVQSIRPLDLEKMTHTCVRGQYGQGNIDGTPVVGYREENDVSPTSSVETFVALKLYIDNWRWAGVPFYLRAGKRMPKRTTEIVVTFRDAPGFLFQNNGEKVEPNTLVIRIQPNEGISLKMNCKAPGVTTPLQPVEMNFLYGSFFGSSPPEAYERLICDCIIGDNTLFARVDEVLASWKLLTPLLEEWDKDKDPNFPNYAAGTWGPNEAEKMLLCDGRKWRTS